MPITPLKSSKIIIPALPNQRQLWFIEHLSQVRTAYNMTRFFRLRGNYLREDVLEKALNELIQRHQSLRSTFKQNGNKIFQIINSASYFNLKKINLSSVPYTERDKLSQQLAEEELYTTFNLKNDSLIRAKLIKFDEKDHLFLLSIHHIICDEWSLQILCKELSIYYKSYLSHRNPGLLMPTLEYSDYVLSRDKDEKNGVFKSQISYWLKHLKNVPLITTFPTKPRPPLATYKGGRYLFTIKKDLVISLKKFSNIFSTTLFSTLLASFLVLIYRYTKQKDIVIGLPTSNRFDHSHESLVGFFLNVLVLRTQIIDTENFVDFLEKVKRTLLNAYDNKEIYFETLINHLNLPRNLSYNPLFQIIISFKDFELTNLQIDNMEVEQIELITDAKLDLAISMSEKIDSGIEVCCNYNFDLFEEQIIKNICSNWQELLNDIIENYSNSLENLCILSLTESKKILQDSRGISTSIPHNKTIIQLFEQQVIETPDNIAIIFEHTSLTYKALNIQIKKFSDYLSSLDINLSRVAICLNRSSNLVTIIMAILKVGGTYTPIDPTYPSERIKFILEDAQVTLVITETILRKLFSSNNSYHIIQIDQQNKCSLSLSNQNFCSINNFNPVAYIIYTSGSTGTPKGVMVSHCSIINCLYSISKDLNISTADSLLAVTTISFDIAVLEIFLPLLNGAKLVIASEKMAVNPQAILRTIIEHKITVLQTTPSRWQMLMDIEWKAPQKIKALCGGEVLTPSLAQILLSRNFELWNLYGPTESTIWCAIKKINNSDDISIGRPISNTQLYVLDKNFHPLPPLIYGELYIGGAGLALGYLNRPLLTKEYFIKKTFVNSEDIEAGWTKIYKTGDVCCYLLNGEIQYKTRLDHQIKIRGMRVELEEIRAIITKHYSIKDAAITIQEDDAGTKMIIAYLVDQYELPNESLQQTKIKDIKIFISAHLPDYMKPHHFIYLKELPLTHNGKINLNQLPAPIISQKKNVQYFPHSEIEKELAVIWTKLLNIKLKNLSTHDNFFDLGGNSLLTIRLTSFIKKFFDIDCEIKDIFANPTIIDLGRYLETSINLKTSKSRNELSPFLRIHGLSPTLAQLKKLVAKKILPTVQAVSLSLLPNQHNNHNCSINKSSRTLKNLKPCLISTIETQFGRIGKIVLPISQLELYTKINYTKKMIFQATKMANILRAKSVALTGLIPSATNYGLNLIKSKENNLLPTITTGHAVTISAVILNIKRILELTKRNLQHEIVGFIGLGSIGSTSLYLMLNHLPHPKKIILCDLYNKQTMIEKIVNQLTTKFNYKGEIEICISQIKASKDLYNGSLIIGATTAADVLEIDYIKPGTIVIDDSDPHCFNVIEGIKRFKQKRDVLFVEGGTIKLPEPTNTSRIYYPEYPEISEVYDPIIEAQSRAANNQVMGCIFSGLLVTNYNEAIPNLGLVTIDVAKQYLALLYKLGITGADPRCSDYIYSSKDIETFRNAFNNNNIPVS